MKQYKIKAISQQKSGHIKYGLTIPNWILKFYPANTYFKIDLMTGSTVGIILTSGTHETYSKEKIKNYEFNDLEI